jgi:hypothetical protein
MAVCEFCKTTLLKDAAAVSNLGKMSDVLEDYSPLQIGTTGQFLQRGFMVIGRIQLKYSAGFWNEWFVLFEDGTNGWLSDASGQFAVTLPIETSATLPLFEKLAPGRPLSVAGQTYITSDVRTAQCTGGQGELPFKVGGGWLARVADFRAREQFLSLDYSDGDPPRVYAGQAAELSALKPQLLRDADRISDTAGRFRGKVSALACPACGAPVKCVPGFTVHIVCPNCHAQVDTAGATATVLAAGAAVEAAQFALALGAEAVIEGVRYALLGAMRRTDGEDDDGSHWNEYLLYAPGTRFIWLIETKDGWLRADVLDRWPSWDGHRNATLDGMNFSLESDSVARVVFAAGSFNWRVSVGDVVRVSEFTAAAGRLAAEMSAEELTWSKARPLPLDQVRAWYGGHVHAVAVPHPRYRETARRVLIALVIVNAIPLLFATANALPYALLGAAAIYLPAYFLDNLDSRGQ